MLTRCVVPACERVFEWTGPGWPDPARSAGRAAFEPPSTPRFRPSWTAESNSSAACPACGAAMRPRPLALLEKLDREHEKRRGRSVAGAPLGPGGQPPPYAVALEDVRSLWNVGSMFRTADGAGFAELYLCGITGCPPDAAIEKVSLGAETELRWEHYRGVLEVLPRLASHGVTVVALERTGASEPLAGAVARGAVKPPLCLVIGNEVEGLSPEAMAAASVRCHVPMRGRKSSLNAAVAFGVAAYCVTGASA